MDIFAPMLEIVLTINVNVMMNLVDIVVNLAVRFLKYINDIFRIIKNVLLQPYQTKRL